MLPRKTINSYFYAAPANRRSYKLLCSSAFRDAPGGTWDPIPDHRHRALYTRLRPQPQAGPLPTSCHQLATTHSRASLSSLVASHAAATLRGPQKGDAFSKGSRGRGHACPRVRGARVGAARCPGEVGIHHPPSGAKRASQIPS